MDDEPLEEEFGIPGEEEEQSKPVPGGGVGQEEEDVREELASLISFANLESVVKHIISKFKKIESRIGKVEEEQGSIRHELSERASMQSVEELAASFGSQFDAITNSASMQKEATTGLEDALERNKVLCTALNNRLETANKEKSIQDRLIREVQDALQDKVAISELNMFEAKFAGYVTKVEHQDLLHVLNDYTKSNITDKILDNLKNLNTRFEDYSRTARIEEWMQELREWVSLELGNFARSDKTYSRINDLANEIKDQTVTVERSFSLMDDKVRGLADRVTSIYVEINDDLHRRALQSHLEALQNDLKNYASQAETQAFQQDCVPKLKFCVDSICAFDERLKAQDGAIQRVDEVLLDKASKYDIVVANSRIEQCMNKDRAMKEFQKMYERLEWMTKRLEHYVATETDRFNQFRPPDYTSTFEDINSKLALKADKADMVEMYALKANRIDADELAKLQDTIHRQLEYLSITNFGLAKLCLTDPKTGESKTVRQQQKSQVMMQSEALWHWIIHNEPPPNLDTLQPPSKAKKAIDAADPAGQSKREMDEKKRAQFENKLGIRSSVNEGLR